jgi:hypothetical protein
MIAVYESVAFVARDQSWGVAQSHLRELMVLTNFLSPCHMISALAGSSPISLGIVYLS